MLLFERLDNPYSIPAVLANGIELQAPVRCLLARVMRRSELLSASARQGLTPVLIDVQLLPEGESLTEGVPVQSGLVVELHVLLVVWSEGGPAGHGHHVLARVAIPSEVGPDGHHELDHVVLCRVGGDGWREHGPEEVEQVVSVAHA